MAIKIPERNYLTFLELQERWKCTEVDLKFAIISSELKPSVRLIGKHVCLTWEISVFGDWVASEYLPGDLGYSLEIEPRGWQYLQDPVQTAPFDCQFRFVSDDRNPEKSETPFSNWHSLPEFMTMQDVMSSGVFMLKEVAFFEAKHGDFSDAVKDEKPLATRERTSYLNIIGAMLAQLTAGKANDTTVITQAVTDYPGKQGLSERKLQEAFAAAKRSLGAS